MTLQTAAANASYGTTASGSSFYAAMRILPREQREAMFQIYSFCRQVDDIADSDGPREARGAEPPPQLRVEVVLRQQAVRAAVRERQDRLPAVLGLGALESFNDEFQRVVPRRALEFAIALSSTANGRVEQAVGSVDALAEFPYLRADVAFGDGISVRSVDRDHFSALHGHREAARIGAIERACRFHDGGGTAKDRFAFGLRRRCHDSVR